MKKKLVLMLSLCTMMMNLPVHAEEVTQNLKYEFDVDTATKAGYAEGTISLTPEKGGTYYLYWADDTKTLKNYYAITEMKLSDGEIGKFTFGEHTAIPVGATKLIAVEADKEADEQLDISKAKYVFEIPKSKRLPHNNGDALYTFNSYSDIHIDEEHWGEAPAYWWEYSEDHWAKALQYAVDKNVDFIVSSGDQVTNASYDNLDKEWKAYQYILSQSDYVNPIWESSGNHEVRQDNYVKEGLKAFIKGTGLDGSAKTLEKNKPYFTVTEPKTGDLFIFMALENGYRPAKYDEFSDKQLDWLEKLLSENYSKGKNIYLIQHALISKYGAGDDVKNPYYGGSINPDLPSTKRFISIIEKYPNIIWISGHTHVDYSMNYNYSNNNGTSCNMIHNSGVGNPTRINSEKEHELDYSFIEDNSQGYYVQVFDNAIIFNGSNLCHEKIFPAYSYIIDGQTSVTNMQKSNESTISSSTNVTSGNLNSIIANTKTVLGVYYKYSSYDQYQALKKCYYNYKDTDTTQMESEELNKAYTELHQSIANLCEIVKVVEK